MNKIFVLIWKNLILRWRHYFATALEILIPVLFVLLVGIWKTTLVRSNTNLTIFPIVEENINCLGFVFGQLLCSSALKNQELKLKASHTLVCPNCTIAYTPDNVHTRAVVQQLKSCLVAGHIVDWRAFDNEQAIDTHVAHLSSNIHLSSRFPAAIVFEEGLEMGGGGASGTVSYKIRLNKVISSDDFHLLFPKSEKSGPDLANSKRYADSGFIGLQICIDKGITNYLTGVALTQNISLQPFPHPAYRSTDHFHQIYFFVLPFFLIIGFGLMIKSIVRIIVSEKETGIRELLKLNGLGSWAQWLSVILNSLLVHIFSVTIIVIIMLTELDLYWVKFVPLYDYSDYTLWWVVLLLYIMSNTSSAVFICSFFTNPSLATEVGQIIWIVTLLFPLEYLLENYDNLSLLYKLSLALLPNAGLVLATRLVISFEGKGAGIQWSNIWESISRDDSLCLGHLILMLILDFLLYSVLANYLENVLPSKFGIRKPWYYIFLPSTYHCNNKITSSAIEDTNVQVNEGEGQPSFENEPSPNVKVGVEMRNLRKEFGKNIVAVDGVSLKLFEGEIFVLLGHNGAGKTTAISMLTGMFAPSGGTALVNGYDTTKALDKARDNLGLCPQHNMLFDELTVSEHLKFFARLKGLDYTFMDLLHLEVNRRDVAAVAETEILKKLQLDDKANTLSKHLSGGQKRKLSLGIALIGKTKVAILDEPTSGMDPEARRAVWDLLLEMRNDRTILLTTHLMEEADVLADRIGIMSSGKLQCCGSSMFLKKFYGAGYTLKMTFSEGPNQQVILPLIQNHIANAELKPIYSTSPQLEMLITLPIDTASTSALLEMFTELSTRKEELGIKTVGLALTTMDEVFLRVGELTNQHPLQKDGNDIHEEVPNKEGNRKLVGLKLVMTQCLALLIKKYIYTYRKWKLTIIQFLIPILLLIVTIMLTNYIVAPPDPPIPLKVTLNDYTNPTTLVSTSDPTISTHLSTVIGTSLKQIPDGTPLVDALLAVGTSNVASYRANYIVAIEANANTTNSINALFNTIPYHAAPLAINIASNLLLKTADPTSDLRIQVTNHPLESKVFSFLVAASPIPVFSKAISIPFGIQISIGLALVATSFIIFPIEEKINKAKQLQMMTVTPLMYWYAAFLWDFLQVLLLCCLLLLCFLIFQTDGFFTSFGGAGVIFLILMAYAFAAIPFSYFFSLFVSTVSGGLSTFSGILITSGVVLSLIVESMETSEKSWLWIIALICRWTGRLFPTFGASMATMKFVQIASKNGRCHLLSDEAKNIICNPSVGLPPELRQCCDNCKVLPGVTCFAPEPSITWSYEVPSSKGLDLVPGVGEELFCLVILALLYQLLLLLLEYKVLQNFCGIVLKNTKMFEKEVTDDDDVIAESKRVAELVKNDRVHEVALVVENFCKGYDSFAAVSMLSFGVHHGECFGLLGINGAGKTTTFEMLTGDKRKSFGNAYGFRKTLDKNRCEFLSNIGYCPQYDGVIEVFSGRQMLQLFSRLRGIPGRAAIDEADEWLNKMGLLESANAQCKNYSGGMKRRLSVAMAMIGDPPLLLLDEPTSGVDPVSRRQFWDVLNSVRDSGQSILLTSHSMDECEALCSRLGIMVNGQLQCLGGVQHLKSKFAQGYTLSLKLKLVNPDSPELQNLREEISDKFKPCVLKDIHQNVLQYQLLNITLGWDEVFKTMEGLKTSFENLIEDYSLNETGLEEVFLSFARKQHENKKENKGQS